MPGNLSKYRGAGVPIGGTMMLPDSGPRLVLADGSEYIRSGTLYAASAYPALAALDVAKAHAFGLAAVSAINFSSMATNGTGIFVGGFGQAVTVHRSTNGGASFTPVDLSAALNGVGDATNVAFGNGLFVCVANQTNSVQIATSADGLSWANRLNHNTSPPWVANRNLVFWTGTYFVAVFGNNTNSRGIWTSPNGTTWTEATMSGFVTGNVDALFGVGIDSKAFIRCANSWGFSNGGSTWSAIGGMSPTITALGRAGSNFVGFAGGTTMRTATPETNTSWVQGTIPRTPSAPALIINPHGSTRAVALLNTGLMHVSDDGVTWNTQYGSAGNAVTAAAWGADLVRCVGASGAFRAAGTTLTAPNAVGTTIYAPNHNGSSAIDHAIYLRAK